jgi:hypothetical protein
MPLYVSRSTTPEASRVAQRLLRRERRAVEAHQDTPWLEEHLRRRRAAVGKAPCGPAPSTRAHDHLAALHGGVDSVPLVPPSLSLP